MRIGPFLITTLKQAAAEWDQAYLDGRATGAGDVLEEYHISTDDKPVTFGEAAKNEMTYNNPWRV